MEEKDVILDRTLFALNFISYRRMEEKVVIADRTLLALNCFDVHFLQKNGGEGCHRGQALVSRFPTKEWGRRMSPWTGPCVMVSYKRMEEKDVIMDRPLCYGFLQKNGGQGCHAGQDLWLVYGRGTRGFILLRRRTFCLVVFGVGFLCLFRSQDTQRMHTSGPVSHNVLSASMSPCV